MANPSLPVLHRPEPPEEFADILAELRHLSRSRTLGYYIEVGDRLLLRFFGGQATAYLDHNPHKDTSFARFLTTCQEELAVFKLGPQRLRDCIKARIVFDTLPVQAREEMDVGHVLELTRVKDPTLRTRLAKAAVEERWTVLALREAVRVAKLGAWYDTDAEQEGVQPPPAPPPRQLSPARLVTRAERLVPELGELVEAWQGADLRRLSGERKARMVVALDELEARVARLRARLAE